jgi:hypothetical protein
MKRAHWALGFFRRQTDSDRNSNPEKHDAWRSVSRPEAMLYLPRRVSKMTMILRGRHYRCG